MKKSDRDKILNKYGGKCAYCGCELTKGWHVDELLPVKRTGTYVRDEDGRILQTANGNYKIKRFYDHPERMCIENQMPACPSCNLQKHSQTLEGFRQSIVQFINSLNLYHNQYKFAKKYGLVQETGIEVKFYFETFNNK